MTTNWQFDWRTDWAAALDAGFLDDWTRGLEADPAGHVFSHPLLVQAWVDAYRTWATVEPRFLLARSVAGQSVWLPLVKWTLNWRNAWHRVLLPVGQHDYDYHDPAGLGSCPPELSAAFWAELGPELTARWGHEVDRVLLEGMRFVGQTPPPGWRETEQCPFLRLDGLATGEDFLRRAPKHFREDCRRQLRRIQAQGQVRFRALTDLEEAVAALPALLAAHAHHWPHSFHAPGLYAALVRRGLLAGLVRLSVLELDERAISWRLGFCYRDRYYSYISAYDPQVACFSPGKLHQFHCLDAALRHGCRVFDLLRGMESYKLALAPELAPLYAWDSRSDRWLARLRLAWCEQVKPQLRRWRRCGN